MSVIRIIPPLFIAASGIVIAQVHGAPAWIALFGSVWIGWAVSLTWEAASVWLWWRGETTWTQVAGKWLATSALVAGMIRQSLLPLLAEGGAARVATKGLDILGQQSTAGHWVSQTTLKRLLQAQHGAPAWTFDATAWASVITMPGLYFLAILALTSASKDWSDHHPTTRPVVSAVNPSTLIDAGERTRLITSYEHKNGLPSQRAVAEALGIPRATIADWMAGKGSPATDYLIRQSIAKANGRT